MSLTVRNDEQIKVGVTVGLVTDSSSFTFDGTDGKPDYRNFEIVPSELNGRGILIRGTDYSWNYLTGEFNLLLIGDIFAVNTVYNIHFQPVGQPIIDNKASIINCSFFVRDITIPNIINTVPPTPAITRIIERVDSFIVKYEQECLYNLFGYSFYKLFLNENSQRMDDILYGVEYIDECGYLQKWQGLVHDEDMSLIANYIYWFFQASSATQTTGVATTLNKSEGGKSMSPVDKMLNAWSFFSSEAKSLIFFLWTRKGNDGKRIYPEYTSHQFFEAKNFSRPTNDFF